MFLAVRDVLVEAWTLEVVSLEELRENTRVRVDHIDIRVAVMSQSLVTIFVPSFPSKCPYRINVNNNRATPVRKTPYRHRTATECAI